jgi:hypothetical protein
MFARLARTLGALGTGVPFALAAILALVTVAGAQQATDDQKTKPIRQKSAAPKSEKSEKSDKKSDVKPAPARKNNGTPVTTSAVPAPGGAQPTLLGQYGDWGAYLANAGGRTICYALAKPTSQATQPSNRPRDPAYVFIATRPAENVRNEVSVVIGYPFKAGYEASVDIGSNKYAMYTQGDGAWVKNPAEEARMVDSMRKGGDLVVTGESGKGTKSTDRYTLKGLSQALDRVTAECK